MRGITSGFASRLSFLSSRQSCQLLFVFRHDISLDKRSCPSVYYLANLIVSYVTLHWHDGLVVFNFIAKRHFKG